MISFPVQEITAFGQLPRANPSSPPDSAYYWATIPLTESTVPLGPENWTQTLPESVAHLLAESVAHFLPESLAHFDRNTHPRLGSTPR